jgi:hypothetical protein
MDPVLLSEVVELLQSCRDVLDNYSDAEYIDGRPVGNQAMRLMNDVDELLVKLALVGAR